MEIPKAPVIHDEYEDNAAQRDADHDFYSKLIEQARIDERKWIGEWLFSKYSDGWEAHGEKPDPNPEVFDLTFYGTELEALKYGRRPEYEVVMVLTKNEVIELDKKYPDKIYCHQCGNRKIILESAVEGYYCPKCGSSDQDE